jgi:4-aminobutyrate aminotransferase-like enzyme
VVEGPAAALAAMRGLLDRGFLALTGGAAGDALTLSPPLTIAPALLAAAAGALGEALWGSVDPK